MNEMVFQQFFVVEGDFSLRQADVHGLGVGSASAKLVDSESCLSMSGKALISEDLHR